MSEILYRGVLSRPLAYNIVLPAADAPSEQGHVLPENRCTIGPLEVQFYNHRQSLEKTYSTCKGWSLPYYPVVTCSLLMSLVLSMAVSLSNCSLCLPD